jgi:hypothetical protein
MTVTSKPIIPSKFASATDTTEYTASTGTRTIIDKFTGYNSTGGSVTLTVNLVAIAGLVSTSNVVVVKTIAAGVTETFPEVCGHSIEPGGFISVVASAATSISIRASGREVT